MEALILRILSVPALAPLRRVAFRVVLRLRSGQILGDPEWPLRRAIHVSARASGPVANWNRATLVAAATRTRSRRAREFVFRLLSRRGNFLSAQIIANQRPFESYAMNMRVAIIRNGLNGTDGIQSDKRLEALLVQNADEIGRFPLACLVDLLYSIRISGLTSVRKIQLLESIGSDSKIVGAKLLAWETTMVETKRGLGQEVEIPSRFYTALSAAVPSNADVGTVRAYWNAGRETVKRTVATRFFREALANPGVSLKHTLFLCRELDDDDILAVVAEEALFASLMQFPEVFSFRTNTAEGNLVSQLLERATTCWFHDSDRRGRTKFDNASVDVQNLIVRLLRRTDGWNAIMSGIESKMFSDTLLDIADARANFSFINDDYQSALVQFEQIVSENPNHTSSWTGLQWSSVRATGELDKVEELRRKIGRGSTHYGRPTVNRAFDDDRIMTSRQWRGDHTRVPLASINRAWLEVQRHFGDRWFDFSRFPKPDSTKDLLLFPIYGVSDEVREAYHYAELVDQYRSVTTVCDPRLLTMLQTTFPTMRFVPYARRVKVLHIDDKRVNPIQGVPSILANYLPDALRELVLSKDTIITPSANFVQQRLANHDYDLRPGAYLTNGRSPVKRAQVGKKRVGVQWRSHLTTGFRGLMYLSLDDLKPIFALKDIQFVSLQHKLSDEERSTLERHGVVQPDVDLFDDFDGISEVIGTLDLVLGLSTFPIEFAAALGCPVWMLGFSPETCYLRTLGGQRRTDILTANSTVIAPDVPRFWLPREVAVVETIEVVLRELRAFT